MNAAGTLLLSLTLLGCRAAPPIRSAQPAASAPTAVAVVPVSPTASSTLELQTDAAEAGLVRGALRLAGGWSGPLAFRGEAEALRTIEAGDDRGPLELDRAPQLGALLLTPRRVPEGPVLVRWSARLPANVGVASRAFRPVAEATELRVAGADVLVLPAADVALPLTLTLRIGATPRAGASAPLDADRTLGATSFGLGAEQRLERRPSELLAASYLAGDLGRADFHAADGDDFTVWAGYTAFDGRWVGAETASVRAAIDDWMGLTPDQRRGAGLLLVPERRDDAGVAIRLSVRGLVASVDPRAAWTAPTRIRAGQALVQRFVGGALWVGDRDREREGAWFSEGFSRAIATQILADGGLIDPDDRAAEINSELATEALSPLGRESRADLAAAPDAREATRVSTARGALVALAFDRALRGREGNDSLKKQLRGWLADAAASADHALPERMVLPAIGAADPALLAALERGAEVPLPTDLLGRCYRLRRGPVAPFELGVELAAAPEGSVVRAVTPGSAAARAGLAPGDVLVDVRWEEGRSGVPVRAKRARSGAITSVSWKPAGASRPGRWFERVASVPDSECRP